MGLQRPRRVGHQHAAGSETRIHYDCEWRHGVGTAPTMTRLNLTRGAFSWRGGTSNQVAALDLDGSIQSRSRRLANGASEWVRLTGEEVSPGVFVLRSPCNAVVVARCYDVEAQKRLLKESAVITL